VLNSSVNTLSSASRTRLITTYAVIAFIISWIIEIPLALEAQGLLSVDIPFSIHYLAAFGPFIAAVIMTWREYGLAGLKNLLGVILNWRVGTCLLFSSWVLSPLQAP
jgi:hypothetical protein